ncbi:unnamed protein product, partial [Mesorhabditis belari]|uniref:Charged multivesicular body protein 7 n=1 Tax=Mesorhabditis belari TaxID=2138241 RepID=A0AAF3J2H7_9BILA
MSPKKYYPATWNDDMEMSGLMSMIKSRQVNPVDYDRKIRFWRGMIESGCYGEKDALLTVDSLKKRFRRGDLVPSSLPIVIEDMINTGDIITLDEWKEKHSSWLGWGFSKMMRTGSWFMGASEPGQRYLHLPTVKKQAEDLLELYSREFGDEVDCTGEVVAWTDLFERAGSVVDSEENFEIVLQFLSDSGDVMVGNARNGEKVLKFKGRRDSGPARFTEADASVHDIRKAMLRLDKEISALEAKAKKLDQDTRAALRSGEKVKATNLLRQKKQADKSLADKDVQYSKLLSMLHQIGSTKDVLQAYKAGTSAFKANLERHGLSPEKIDATMDEVQEAAEEFHDITDAMSQGIAGIRAGVQDEELERELEELMSGQKTPEKPIRELDLPSVPQNRLGLSQEDSEVEPRTPAQMSLEERLRKLRQMAA